MSGFHRGGVVPPAGGYYLHRGEVIVPLSAMQIAHRRDVAAGCRCEWADDYVIAKLSERCPFEEHRIARADAYRPRRIARELLRDVTGALKRLVFWGA